MSLSCLLNSLYDNYLKAISLYNDGNSDDCYIVKNLLLEYSIVLANVYCCDKGSAGLYRLNLSNKFEAEHLINDKLSLDDSSKVPSNFQVITLHKNAEVDINHEVSYIKEIAPYASDNLRRFMKIENSKRTLEHGIIKESLILGGKGLNAETLNKYIKLFKNINESYTFVNYYGVSINESLDRGVFVRIPLYRKTTKDNILYDNLILRKTLDFESVFLSQRYVTKIVEKKPGFQAINPMNSLIIPYGLFENGTSIIEVECMKIRDNISIGIYTNILFHSTKIKMITTNPKYDDFMQIKLLLLNVFGPIFVQLQQLDLVA